MSGTAQTISPTKHSRLSLWQAAWVVARRDFLAVLFSRAFLFFLLGPLFPIFIGGLAGGVSGEVQRQATATKIGVVMSAQEQRSLSIAYAHLRDEVGLALPPMAAEVVPEGEPLPDPKGLLAAKDKNYLAILSGSIADPVLSGREGQINRLAGSVSLVLEEAREPGLTDYPEITLDELQTTAANVRTDRIKTAQTAQLLLFLLTMLLAGMVLSNLVEEKANKIIEILAAAIPLDALFLGKLFAMLGVSLAGILVWGSAATGFVLVAGDAIAQLTGQNLSEMPTPALGWPAFFALCLAYFSMAYLLLGSLFLTIGGMAATVREVQTLSMPVTMAQVLVIFFAASAIPFMGTPYEMSAVLFPLSSPFAMLARAAMLDAVWPHVLALAWQALWVAITVRMGTRLFRKRVLKSGSGGTEKKRRWWHRRAAA